MTVIMKYSIDEQNDAHTSEFNSRFRSERLGYSLGFGILAGFSKFIELQCWGWYGTRATWHLFSSKDNTKMSISSKFLSKIFLG